MAEFDLLNFRRQIIENNIILSFEGKMSQGVLITLVDTIKEKLTSNEDNSTDSMQYTVRKIYSIFVELAQNIQNHSSEKITIDQQGTGVGIIVIRENPSCFTIASGNCILIENMTHLKSYCDYLNTLDESGLKKVYKEKLRSSRKEEVTGAGIGLIEIMRKSGSHLEYEMKPLNEQSIFFTLSVNLSKGV